MSKTAPCKDCPDRHPNCHSKCAKYKDFRHELDIKAEAIRKQKYIEQLAIRHIKK